METLDPTLPIWFYEPRTCITVWFCASVAHRCLPRHLSWPMPRHPSSLFAPCCAQNTLFARQASFCPCSDPLRYSSGSLRTNSETMHTYLVSVRTKQVSLHTYLESLRTKLESFRTYLGSLHNHLESLRTYLGSVRTSFSGTKGHFSALL